MKTIIYSVFSLSLLLSLSDISFSQDYWTKLNGPYGGNVIDLRKGPNGKLYALRSDKVYVSDDNSESWNRIEQLTGNTNLCMDISPSGIIYVGKSSGGIWWSANSGQSWDFNPVNVAPHSGSWASVILVKVNNAGHIFINNWVSLNGGSTFTFFNIGSPSALARDYAFNSSGHVYAATNYGVFYSVNNGSSWTNINANTSTTSLMFDNNILIAGVKGAGIYKTTNNGVTWDLISSGITDLNINKLYKDSQNNYYTGTTTGKVFKSSDAGASWSEIYNSASNNTVNSIYIEGSSAYLSTNALGIVRSDNNGNTWTQKNKNLSLQGINSLEYSGNEIYAASNAGIYYSPDNGQNWEKRGSMLPSLYVTSILKCPNGDLLTGLYSGGVYRSDDNGFSWNSSNKGMEQNRKINYLEKSNGYVFAATLPAFLTDTMKLYRSPDNGMSWTKILQSAETSFDKFTIDGSGKLYAAGTGMTFELTIMKSTDNGNSWSTNVLPQFFLMDNFCSSSNDLYMTSNPNLYKSTDEGMTWNQLSQGNWQPAVISKLNVNNRGDIFAFAGGQFYITTNNGAVWTTQNSGLIPSVSANNLLLKNNGYLFMTTYYDGIFKSANSTITSTGNTGGNIPAEFMLSQNYPNPFNPSTNLEFGISISGFVSLKIYDILGKEVRTIVYENLQTGTYTIKFNAGDLPGGVYFYKLRSGNFEKVRKMILLK